MKYEKYPYKSENRFEFFEFYSVGPKGEIRKVVEFQPTSEEGIYNLAFGDYDKDAKGIDDMVVTNNGDSLKVLSTVASIVYVFLDKHPGAWVMATGSTEARTRLYRMGITNNLAEIQEDFFIFGYTDERGWDEFVIGEDYLAFLVNKKERNEEKK